MKSIWVIIGTRPEAIKQCPLYIYLKTHWKTVDVKLVVTNQHRDLITPVLARFGVKGDIELDSQPNDEASLSSKCASILDRMGRLIEAHSPSLMIVQGDTATACFSAWAGFLQGVPIIHNEAGLRTFDTFSPFPEEANRRAISALASLHLAPSSNARSNLLREQIETDDIEVVGNTGIDALKFALQCQPSPKAKDILDHSLETSLVLVTAHRRENAELMNEWFSALGIFATEHSNLKLVCPLHPNQLARTAAKTFIGSSENVILCEPFDFVDMAHLLKRCRLVVTDSGGIQEEAATLGIPTVVCRASTERPEAIDWGTAVLSELDTQSILACMRAGLHVRPKVPFDKDSPFGVGKSSEKILAVLKKRYRF